MFQVMTTVTLPPGPIAVTVVSCALALVQLSDTGYELAVRDRSALMGAENASPTRPRATATWVALLVVHVAEAMTLAMGPMQCTVVSLPGPLA